MKMAKQSSEVFQEMSEVLCESLNAKIHAVVESLLPMKKSSPLPLYDAVSICFHFCSLA